MPGGITTTLKMVSIIGYTMHNTWHPDIHQQSFRLKNLGLSYNGCRIVVLANVLEISETLFTKLPWQRCFVLAKGLDGRLSWLDRSLRELWVLLHPVGSSPLARTKQRCHGCLVNNVSYVSNTLANYIHTFVTSCISVSCTQVCGHFQISLTSCCRHSDHSSKGEDR